MNDDRDIGPDNGHRPPFAKPIDEGRGDVGTGDGYSGQEYDSEGQQEWREADLAKQVSPDGLAHGSGGPGEEIDPETKGA